MQGYEANFELCGIQNRHIIFLKNRKNDCVLKNVLHLPNEHSVLS